MRRVGAGAVWASEASKALGGFGLRAYCGDLAV